MIERIISAQNSRFKRAAKLLSSRGRQQQDRIIVLGFREVIRAAIAGAAFEEIIFEDGKTEALEQDDQFKRLKDLAAKTASCRFFAFSADLMQRLSYGEREVDVIGIACRPDTDFKRVSSTIDQSKGIIVVLESLEKPGNLGAIARSADGVGVDAILIADSLTDPFHPNAIRSSVSTVFAIPIACGASREIQAWLMTNEYQICFATPEAKRSLFDVRLPGKIALVFGNEAHGLSAAWREFGGEGVCLPMLGVGDSLNVSVTASVMLYETLRQKLRLSDKS